MRKKLKQRKLLKQRKKLKKPKQPIRIVLDSHCRTPEDSLAVKGEIKTILVTHKECNKNYGKNVEILICSVDENGIINLKESRNNHGI